MDVGEFLRGTDLFRDLRKDEIDLIARSTRLENFKTGHVIVREGRVGRAFFIIVSGSVEVLKHLGSPDEKVLATLGAGEFFGEIAAVKNLPRSASVRAAADTECLVIWRADFDGFLSRFPEAADKVESVARARMAQGHSAFRD